MQLRRHLAFLVALVVLLVAASAVAGLPAALDSTGTVAVAGVCTVVVLVGIVAGGRGAGPRTTYW